MKPILINYNSSTYRHLPLDIIKKPNPMEYYNNNRDAYIYKWINNYIDEDINNLDIIDVINVMIRNFLDKYNITLPAKFDDELINFLFDNSI